MQILIDIPDEQIKKSLEESKYIHEDEGEKGFVNIAMLYTNARLEFVAVERKTDFYDCKYKILPKGHGRLIDAEKLESRMYHEAFETDSDLQKWDSGCWIRYKMFEQIIQKAETIIEVKLESEE